MTCSRPRKACYVGSGSAHLMPDSSCRKFCFTLRIMRSKHQNARASSSKVISMGTARSDILQRSRPASPHAHHAAAPPDSSLREEGYFADRKADTRKWLCQIFKRGYETDAVLCRRVGITGGTVYCRQALTPDNSLSLGRAQHRPIAAV